MKMNSSLAHLTKTGGGVVVDDDVRRYDTVSFDSLDHVMFI